MAISDHGGYDVAVEVSEELLTAATSGGRFPVNRPADRAIRNAEIDATVRTSSVAPTGVDVTTGEVVTVVGSFVGTLAITRLVLDGSPVPLPTGLAPIPLIGTFRISTTAAIGAVGGSRGVALTPDPAGSTLTIDEAPFLASMPVVLVLAAAFVSGGQAAYDRRRTALLDLLRANTTQVAREMAAKLAATLVVTEPAGVTFDAVHTTEVTLKVLVIAGRAPGNVRLVSGTTVRRNSLGGPLDHAAFVLNNSTLLGAVRPALAGALGIGTGIPPWFGGHPCLLVGSVPVAPRSVPIPTVVGGAPAVTLFADVIHGFVNAAGMLQVDLTVRAVSWAGLATVVTKATATAALVPPVAGGTLTLGLGVPTITTVSDVSVDPALYLIGAYSGGSLAVTILAAIDLFAGPAIDTIVRGALAAIGAGITLPSFTFPLGGAIATLSVTQFLTTEPTAPTRTVTVGSFTFALDRAHDVILRLA